MLAFNTTMLRAGACVVSHLPRAENGKKAVNAVGAGEAKLLERDERSAILEDAARILDELCTGRDTNKAK